MLEKDLKFDKRITDRNIKRGTLVAGEMEAHLQSLADLTEKADIQTISVESRPAELDDEEEEEQA